MAVPIVHVDLDDLAALNGVRVYLSRAMKGQIHITSDGLSTASARLMSLERAMDTEHSPVPVIAIADAALPVIIQAMQERPWLNHVATPKVMDERYWGQSLVAALSRLVGGTPKLRTSLFSAVPMHGRRAALRKSDGREKRCDAISAFALEAGAPASVAELIREVADELITNALYDAPAERAGVKADRSQPVLLAREEACGVVYGSSAEMFYLCVHDCCGSLRRSRLLEVLGRCAQPGGADIDPSRGGAGLGLWRVFSGASLVAIETQSQQSTEFLVGIDLHRGRRSTHGRAVHLFFDVPRSTARLL